MNFWIKYLIVCCALFVAACFSTKYFQNTNIAYFYMRAGELCFHLGGTEKAESLYLKAVDRLQPHSSCRLVKDLRLLAWKRGYVDLEHEKGVSILKHALLVSEKESEELADLYRELGEALNYIGHYAEAEQAWHQSIDLHRKLKNSDKQFDVSLKMVISFAAREKWDEAEKQLISAISFRDLGDSEIGSDSHTLTEACILLGKLTLHIVKNKEKALEYNLKACEYAKNSCLKQQIHVQIAMGSYYESSDQFEEAIQKYRHAMELCSGAHMEEEEDYILHTVQGCLRKFNMAPPEDD